MKEFKDIKADLHKTLKSSNLELNKFKSEVNRLESSYELLEKMFNYACKLIDDLTGDCPIDHNELMFVKDCENECENCGEAVSCWKEYIYQEVKNEIK